MKICSDDHPEICWYDEGGCPLCESLDKVHRLENYVEDLKEEIIEIYEKIELRKLNIAGT